LLEWKGRGNSWLLEYAFVEGESEDESDAGMDPEEDRQGLDKEIDEADDEFDENTDETRADETSKISATRKGILRHISMLTEILVVAS
jgi:hypothetical protein